MRSILETVLPAALRGFISITELDEAELLVAPLFRRKSGDAPPDVPHHLVGLYRRPDGQLSLLGYSHMRPFGDIYLSGGSCSEGEAIRGMLPEHRERGSPPAPSGCTCSRTPSPSTTRTAKPSSATPAMPARCRSRPRPALSTPGIRT